MLHPYVVYTSITRECSVGTTSARSYFVSIFVQATTVLGADRELETATRGSCKSVDCCIVDNASISSFVSTLGESLHCARALHAHCALLLDYVSPEEPPSTPLGNALRIR